MQKNTIQKKLKMLISFLVDSKRPAAPPQQGGIWRRKKEIIMQKQQFKIGQLVCQTRFYSDSIKGTAAPISVAGLITRITPKYLHLNVRYGWPGATSVPGFVAMKMKKELFI